MGKTTLCKALDGAEYFDCELPSVRVQLEDPEFFFKGHKNKTIVLDEIHRASDPSNILKIGADHFPSIKIIATGSSTLAAKKKFKDTLTDRKRNLWLQPLLPSELESEGRLDMDRRLLHGGLPPAYLADSSNDRFFQEWLDSFWAKDIQELFVVDKKTSFLKLAEMILIQSGQIFEASSFASPCEVSRQTITNYLEILSTTLFANILRPFSQNKENEIVSASKVYGREGVFYWRDKQKHEIDFVVKPKRGEIVHAVECKSKYQNFNVKNLKIFRKKYPHGKNILVSLNVSETLNLNFSGIDVMCIPVHHVPKLRL